LSEKITKSVRSVIVFRSNAPPPLPILLASTTQATLFLTIWVKIVPLKESVMVIYIRTHILTLVPFPSAVLSVQVRAFCVQRPEN